MLSVTEIPKRADPSIDSNGGMQKASDILARSSDEFSSPSSSDSNSQSEKAYTKTSPRCPQRPPILWRFNPLWTWRLIYHMKTNKNIFNIITYGGMFVDLEEDGPQTQTECIKIIVEDLFGFEGCAGRKHGKDYRRNPRNFIKAVRSRFLRLKDHYKGNCIELGEICARIKRKDIPENSEIAHRIEKIKKKFPWWNAIHRLWRSSRDHNPFGDALSLEKIVDLAMRKGQEHLFLTKSRLKTIEESPEGQLIRYRMEMRARYSFDFCENSDVEVENMGTEKDRRSNIQSPGDLVDAGDQIQTDGPDNFESESEASDEIGAYVMTEEAIEASEINVIARALGSNTSARAGPNLANDAGDESRENIVTRRYLSVDDGSDGEESYHSPIVENTPDSSSNRLDRGKGKAARSRNVKNKSYISKETQAMATVSVEHASCRRVDHTSKPASSRSVIDWLDKIEGYRYPSSSSSYDGEDVSDNDSELTMKCH